jgi:hypothetical protein
MIMTRRCRAPGRGGAGVLAGWLAVGAALSARPALAGGEANRPPTTASVPISLPVREPGAVKTIAQQITLTEQEATVLEDVQDRTGKFDETALYVMFAVAARAPQLDPIEWHELDSPSYANLLAQPDRYRATPLQTKVKVYVVTKRQAGAGLGFRPKLWPKDKPVWEMDCVQTGVPHEEDKPLKVFSIVNPKEFIGEADRTDRYRRGIYKGGRRIRIAALFYKVYRAREEGSGEMRDYPELVAWQLSRTALPLRGAGGGLGSLANFLPLLLLIIALAVGFYFTRRRLAKLKADHAPGARYRPLGYRSDTQAPGPPEPEGARDAKEQADGPVDPDLAAAAEEYLREHEEEQDDGRDGEGRWR